MKTLNPLKKIICILSFFLGMQLLAQTPANISLVFYLSEKSENGTLVGTVSATDPDGDVLAYSIVSGNDLGAFAINSGSGNITVADEAHLNFDVNPTFVLQVQADDGNGGMTAVQVTINLIDIPLGLDDPLNGIHIFPNPVSTRLYVNLKDDVHEGLSINLYTLKGSQVLGLKEITNAHQELDVSGLKPGVYMLRISSENELLASTRVLVR